jgi:hypothetical protein
VPSDFPSVTVSWLAARDRLGMRIRWVGDAPDPAPHARAGRCHQRTHPGGVRQPRRAAIAGAVPRQQPDSSGHQRAKPGFGHQPRTRRAMEEDNAPIPRRTSVQRLQHPAVSQPDMELTRGHARPRDGMGTGRVRQERRPGVPALKPLNQKDRRADGSVRRSSRWPGSQVRSRGWRWQYDRPCHSSWGRRRTGRYAVVAGLTPWDLALVH